MSMIILTPYSQRGRYAGAGTLVAGTLAFRNEDGTIDFYAPPDDSFMKDIK